MLKIREELTPSVERSNLCDEDKEARTASAKRRDTDNVAGIVALLANDSAINFH